MRSEIFAGTVPSGARLIPARPSWFASVSPDARRGQFPASTTPDFPPEPRDFSLAAKRLSRNPQGKTTASRRPVPLPAVSGFLEEESVQTVTSAPGPPHFCRAALRGPENTRYGNARTGRSQHSALEFRGHHHTPVQLRRPYRTNV